VIRCRVCGPAGAAASSGMATLSKHLHGLLLSIVIFALACSSLVAQGRDWFVRAGTPDGDGSRERPFADP